MLSYKIQLKNSLKITIDIKTYMVSKAYNNVKSLHRIVIELIKIITDKSSWATGLKLLRDEDFLVLSLSLSQKIRT